MSGEPSTMIKRYFCRVAHRYRFKPTEFLFVLTDDTVWWVKHDEPPSHLPSKPKDPSIWEAPIAQSPQTRENEFLQTTEALIQTMAKLTTNTTSKDAESEIRNILLNAKMFSLDDGENTVLGENVLSLASIKHPQTLLSLTVVTWNLNGIRSDDKDRIPLVCWEFQAGKAGNNTNLQQYPKLCEPILTTENDYITTCALKSANFIKEILSLDSPTITGSFSKKNQHTKIFTPTFGHKRIGGGYEPKTSI